MTMPVDREKLKALTSLAQAKLAGMGEEVTAAAGAAVESRWEPARERARRTTGTVEERVKAVTDACARELVAMGAASGGAAAAPGVGRAISRAASAGEAGRSTARLADLILTIAVIHGHDRASVDERRAWVLSVLAFGEGAGRGFAKVAGGAGQGLSRKALERIPGVSLRAVNGAVGRTLVGQGTRRGAQLLGKALPFGVGAVLGGGLNYVTVKAVARQADEFFRELGTPELPPAAELPPAPMIQARVIREENEE